ncbi:MAG: DoxX family protein [bacterium]
MYGSACFFSPYMKGEFTRWGFGAQRALVGGLQLCAVVGLLAGFEQPLLGRAASVGLALMMLVAVGVRIRIKDSIMQTIPALLYLVLQVYLSLAAF